MLTPINSTLVILAVLCQQYVKRTQRYTLRKYHKSYRCPEYICEIPPDHEQERSNHYLRYALYSEILVQNFNQAIARDHKWDHVFNVNRFG